MVEERERFYSRLSTIPGIRPMPSVGNWILFEAEQPSDLVRRINRRMSESVASVPRNVPKAVRIPVKDPKANEVLFNTLRDLVVGKNQHFFNADPAPEFL